MIKKVIKMKFAICKIVTAVKKKFYREIPFTTSEEYWIERYKRKGNSGSGSYDVLAEFKAEVINSFVAGNKISTVIEFGCGDGNQLRYFDFESYLGFDVSLEAISICTKLFKNDLSKQFKLSKNYSNETADLTMSLDVIYHLVENQVYSAYMERLFRSSRKFVIVYSSNSDEHENNGMVPHVKHRKFTNWVAKNATDFELIKHIPNDYPFDGEGSDGSYADFYIFKNTRNVK